jgi:carboxyl-terminal processing protease
MNKSLTSVVKVLSLLSAGVLIGLLLGNTLHRRFIFSKNQKLAKIVQLVQDKYVDNVNSDSLAGEAAGHLLQNLDPHSLYLPPERVAFVNEHLEGGFDGIGIEYLQSNDSLFITQVYPSGPGAKAGLAGGTCILTLNNKKLTAAKLTNSQITTAFREVTGSDMVLTVQKNYHAPVQTINLTRGRVTLSSIDAFNMPAPGVGYIKLSKFASTTQHDFENALRRLKQQGMQKLILDLRGNGGGYLNAATAMADEFLPKGKLIVFTKGTHEPRTDYTSTDSGYFKTGKLAVLIDEHSASASEILAGALQDLDRAVIVGRRSFGKGLVQQQFSFDDGSAINLTVARYYTPSGRSIQKSYKNGVDSYHNELAERMQKGELFSERSNFSDSVFLQPSKFHTSSGKKVYSGGGIMPDVFVPADSNNLTTLISELNQQQLFTSFVIHRMQGQLNTYHNFESLNASYFVTEAAFQDFIQFASATLKEMDSQEIGRSKPFIKLLIKANAARFKWGDQAYYAVMNNNDMALKKAINLLN